MLICHASSERSPEPLPSLHVSEGWLSVEQYDGSFSLLFVKNCIIMKKGRPAPFGVVVLGHAGKYRPLDLAIVRQKTTETELKEYGISHVGYCAEEHSILTLPYQNGRKSRQDILHHLAPGSFVSKPHFNHW